MGRKLYRNADSEFLVSKIREVGSRSKLDRVKLVSASIAISNRDTSDILAGLGSIASDGLVSPIEKRQLDMLFRQLKAEYPTVESEAEKYKELPDWKVEYTAQLEAYEKAYSDFSALLSEMLKDMKASSPVSQAQLSTIAQAYYTALSTLDSTLQQFRYGIDRMEFRYKATQTQTKPNADDVTLENVPTLSSTDKYLWRKQTIYYTSGKVDVTVDLIGVYGDSGADGKDGADGADGKDAKVCTIVCDRDYVERNDRLSDSLVYTFTIEVQGYAGVATVEVNGVDRTNSLSTEGSRYTLKVTVARKEAYALTAVVKLDGEEMARLALSVIDRTGSALYLGEFSDSLPTSSQYGMLIEGDYFIASETFTDSSNNQYSKGVPYVYRKDGSNWIWSQLDSTDKDYNTKMLECMGGVMKSGIAVPSTAAMYGWFQNLVAQNAVFATLASNEAFIKLLKVYSLFVGTGSRTSGFYVEIADHQEGSTTQEILFNVWFNGSKVFSIDPSTGNVYIGSGFFYRASDETIRSSSGKVVIDSGGQLTAQSAVLENAVISKNSLFHGSFDCDVIKTEKNNPTQTAIPLTTISLFQVSSIWNGYVVANNFIKDYLFECTVSGIPNIAWCKFYYKYSKNGTSFSNLYQIYFYDKELSPVDLTNYISTHNWYVSSGSFFYWISSDIASYERNNAGVWFSQSRTLTIFSGGNVLKIDVPSNSLNLTAGMVYSDNGTLKIVT